jgi:hypothetical protein
MGSASAAAASVVVGVIRSSGSGIMARMLEVRLGRGRTMG